MRIALIESKIWTSYSGFHIAHGRPPGVSIEVQFAIFVDERKQRSVFETRPGGCETSERCVAVVQTAARPRISLHFPFW